MQNLMQLNKTKTHKWSQLQAVCDLIWLTLSHVYLCVRETHFLLQLRVEENTCLLLFLSLSTQHFCVCLYLGREEQHKAVYCVGQYLGNRQHCSLIMTHLNQRPMIHCIIGFSFSCNT